MSAQKIALIEQDAVLRTALAEQLQLNGEFDCVEQADAETALVLLAQQDMSAADAACAALREEGIRAPIILLGDTPSEAAEDVVPKPFRFAILMGAIRTQLRQSEKSDDGVKLGAFEFWPSEKALVDGAGERLRLTEKETAMLKYLLRSSEEIISRDELLAQVWGYNSGVTTHTLETHVYRLRQKLGQNEKGEEILVTEPGGYRLAR